MSETKGLMDRIENLEGVNTELVEENTELAGENERQKTIIRWGAIVGGVTLVGVTVYAVFKGKGSNFTSAKTGARPVGKITHIGVGKYQGLPPMPLGVGEMYPGDFSDNVGTVLNMAKEFKGAEKVLGTKLHGSWWGRAADGGVRTSKTIADAVKKHTATIDAPKALKLVADKAAS
jgi:hypothetical protein